MGALVLAACVGATAAMADTVAISFGGFGGGGFNYTQGTYLAGFEFRAQAAISVTQLGFYDASSNGQPQTFQNAPVGLWDITTNTLLGSVTVTAANPLTGFFRYAALSTPIALNTTDTYAVAGITGTNLYTAGVPPNSSSVVVNAPVVYLAPALESSGESTTLHEPDYFPTAYGFFADFGSNFQFTTASNTAVANYYFSDFVFGENWESTLTYINYSQQTVTCTTTFYGDGALQAVPFAQGSITTRTDVLAPGGSIHDPTTAPHTGTVMQGWAQASCTGPVQASMLFRQFNAGAPIAEAGVNAEAAPATEFATFAQTATAVAYANPSTTQSATITFTVYDNTGARLGSQSITLGPLAHGASNIGPLLGLASFTGFVKVTSTIPIISLSLNFEVAPIFSSLPPGDLPSNTQLVTP
jgi:Domain of unknown function (DUF4082)